MSNAIKPNSPAVEEAINNYHAYTAAYEIMRLESIRANIDKPNSIEILGKIYKVSYLDDLNMQGMLGSAKRSQQQINISLQQTNDSMQETLLHEIIHIIDGDLVLNLSEETVARLAVGIYSAGYRLHNKE